jgi:hypothetical protein
MTYIIGFASQTRKDGYLYGCMILSLSLKELAHYLSVLEEKFHRVLQSHIWKSFLLTREMISGTPSKGIATLEDDGPVPLYARQ